MTKDCPLHRAQRLNNMVHGIRCTKPGSGATSCTRILLNRTPLGWMCPPKWFHVCCVEPKDSTTCVTGSGAKRRHSVLPGLCRPYRLETDSGAIEPESGASLGAVLRSGCMCVVQAGLSRHPVQKYGNRLSQVCVDPTGLNRIPVQTESNGHRCGLRFRS